MSKTSVHGLQLTLCVSLALGAGAASAQDASAPAASSSNDLADIIVTARRVEERLQDVPVSIQVLNQQQLTERDITNSSELAQYTPSLSANVNFGTEETTFAIRGFNQDQGSPPSVGVYFADVVSPRGNGNGIPIGDGATHGDFFDLANVQILKGPQGTLFGLNTTGGAILFVPQKPTSEFGGFAELSYGNYDMHRETAALNLPISDTVRFRLAVDQMDRSGYLNNNSGIGPARLENTNYVAARASLVVDITPNLENYTIASFGRSDDNGGVQKMIACDPTSGTGAGFACPQLAANKNQGFYTVQQDLGAPETLLYNYQLINTTTWHASDAFTLKDIASYAQSFERVNNALFGTNFGIGPTLPPIVFSTIQSAPGTWSSAEFTFTNELQAQGTVLNDRLTYQGGLYVEGSDPISAGGNQSPVFISCANAAQLNCLDVLGIEESGIYGVPIHVGSVNYTVGTTTYRDYGIYEQSTYTITDQLKATGGARFTYDTSSSTAQRITYSFPVLPPVGPATGVCTDLTSTPNNCYQTSEETSHAPTWMMDLEYKPIEDLMLYGKYSRGYRAGGVFANAPSDYRTFQPEKLDSFETGIKTTFNGPVRGTFDATAFYNNFRNQQLQASFDAAPGAAVSPTTGIINAGKSKIWGAEIEATLSPVAGLVFTADYTYLRTEITAIAPIVSTDPNYIVGQNITVGSPLELSPKNKAVVSIDYTLPLPQAIGKISGGVTGTHIDRQLANYTYLGDPANIAEEGGDYSWLAARNLLDAHASWNSIMGSHVDLSFFGTNLTNLHYFSYIPGLGTPAVGFETAVLGEPRMFGVRARYRFGGG